MTGTHGHARYTARQHVSITLHVLAGLLVDEALESEEGALLNRRVDVQHTRIARANDCREVENLLPVPSQHPNARAAGRGRRRCLCPEG